MLRGAAKQFINILLRAPVKQPSSLTLVTATAKTLSVTTQLPQQRICRSGVHTSANFNSGKSHDPGKDSVRQKGIDVTPDSSQQIPFHNTGRSFGGVKFPTLETFTESFDGVPFNQIPIVHIKATSNNTIVSVTDGDGVVLAIQSGGTVGFRNARKGTNVAAQAAAIALADDALRKDIKQARVCVRGIGPGRFPALKAIEMSGIKVVSITDTTRLPHNGNRPKKVRRL